MVDNTNVIHIHPSSELYYGLALKQFEKMNIERGITFFQRGISLAKNQSEEIYGRIQLALMYQHNNQFSDSASLIDLLLEDVQDKYPDLYYFQAINYMFLNYKEDAKKSVQHFLANARNSSYVEDAEAILETLYKG